QVNEELTEAHRIAVKECIQNADKLTDLHNQILACDQVFERLEKMLLGFQGDLGTISEDMKRLQEQSVSINQELENRQKVRGELSQFVDDIIVPQNMIKVIMETDVNDRAFLEQLHELQHKINFIKAQESKDARSVYDVLGVLESLKFKAIEKIREWILSKVYMFRKPLSNYQVPQHQLLKSRFFYEFLAANESNIAQEVQDEYVDTVSKMFFSYFKAYVTRLFKLLMLDAASKDDLLGAEDVVKSGGISGLFAGKPHHRNRATVFSLGSRQEILTRDFLNPLIVPHAAQEANQKILGSNIKSTVDRLAQVMQMHNDSVKALDVKRMQTPIDTRPHYLGKKMEAILESCEDAVEQLLLRMSSCLPNTRDRLVFLINNYDLTLGIIDAVFTQLVQYVQRFSKLVSHEIFRDNPARNDMVNIHHILVELKKYK
ncbi:Vps52 / Sac2 family protein, partial [Ostertagia ostertagi]